MMDTDESASSVPGPSGVKSHKRSFLEALKEFSTQQTQPNPKRINVDANATDTIRIEINKVLVHIIS
jgi:hypothetical protein